MYSSLRARAPGYARGVEQRLWFQSAVESLLVRGVGDDLTPALKAELLAVGLDVERLLPAYDVALVVRAVDIVARHRPHPEGPVATRRAIGRRFLSSYSETLLGRAMVAAMRLLSPERVLGRMERNFRTGTNYMRTRFTLVEPGHGRLHVDDVEGLEDVWGGIIEQGSEFIDAKSTVAFEKDASGPGGTYVVRWPLR
jgi:uncharacterized protein (TIGR02265 family)